MGEQKAFLIYKRYWQQIQKLSDAQAGELMKAIFAYMCDGTVVEISDLAVDILFGVIKDDLDADAEQFAVKSAKRAEAGRKGAEKRWSDDADETPAGEDTVESMANANNANGKNGNAIFAIENEDSKIAKMANTNTNTNTNTNILKEKEYTSYIPKRKDDKFVPPTVDDVEKYAKEKGYTGFNAETFVSFYQSKGWMVGKNKMKDWQAAVRQWHSRDKDKPAAQQKIIPAPQRYQSENRDLDFLTR